MKQYDQLTHSFERDGGYAYKSEITGQFSALSARLLYMETADRSREK